MERTYNCVTCDIRITKSKGGRPPKRSKKTGRPPKVVSVSDMINVSSCRQITPEIERAVANVLKVKSQHSSSNAIQIKTGGSQPMTVAPVTVAGSSYEAVAMQTSHIIKSYDSKQREDIFKNFKHTISVPEDAVASMKSVLGG